MFIEISRVAESEPLSLSIFLNDEQVASLSGLTLAPDQSGVEVDLGPRPPSPLSVQVRATLLRGDNTTSEEEVVVSLPEPGVTAQSPQYKNAKPYVHAYVAWQAFRLLPEGRAKAELESYLYLESELDPSEAFANTVVWPEDYPEPPAAWSAGAEPTKHGSSIFEGTWEEDEDDYGILPILQDASLRHFWDPDGGFDWGLLLDPLPRNNSALFQAEAWWNASVLHYPSDRSQSFYELGRVAHLLGDMGVPDHAHNDAHVGRALSTVPFDDFSAYEEWTALNYRRFAGTFGPPKDASNLDLTVPAAYLPTSYDQELGRLFYNMTQFTGHADSANAQGNNVGPDGAAFSPPMTGIAVASPPHRIQYPAKAYLSDFIDPAGTPTFRWGRGCNILKSCASWTPVFECPATNAPAACVDVSRAYKQVSVPQSFWSQIAALDVLEVNYTYRGNPRTEKIQNFDTPQTGEFWSVPDRFMVGQYVALFPENVSYVAGLFRLYLDKFWKRLSVNTTGTGTGRVVSTPSGIDCGGICAEDFETNTVVTLTPTPSVGSTFAGWSGEGCGGGGDCMVTMTQARNVTAAFSASGGGGGDAASITATAVPASLQVNQASTIAAVVKDAAGDPVSEGTIVTFETAFPGFFSTGGICYGSCTAVTDSTGTATRAFTGQASGTAIITVSTGGRSATAPVTFTPPPGVGSIAVTAAYRRSTATSTTYTVTAMVRTASGGAVPYPWVDFTASAGTPPSITDQGSVEGDASFELTVTESGLVTVTASSGGVTGATTIAAQVGGTSSVMLPVRTLISGSDVQGVAFSGDGARLFAADNSNGTLQAWNTADWSAAWSKQTGNSPRQVAVNSTSSSVAVGTSQGLEIRDAASGNKTCQANTTATRFVTWLGSSSLASIQPTSSATATVLLHSPSCSAGSPVAAQPPADEVFIAYSNLSSDATGSRFAAGSSAGNVWVWSSSGTLISKPQLVNDYDAMDTAFSPDGGKLAASGFYAFKVYDTGTWVGTDYSVAEAGQRKTSVVFIDSGTKMAVGGYLSQPGAIGGLAIVDAASGATLRAATFPTNPPMEMSWNESTKDLAVAVKNGGLLIFRPLDPADVAGPLVSVATPTSGFVTNQVSIGTTGCVSDQTGVSTFTINGAAVPLDANGNFSYLVTGLTEGVNAIAYHSVDPFGNAADTTVNVVRVVDRTAPMISNCSVTPSSGVAGTAFALACTVIDGDTGVANVTGAVRNGSGAAVATVPMGANGSGSFGGLFDSTGQAPGAFSVDVTAVDSSPQANAVTTVAAMGFAVMYPAPTIDSILPATGATTGGTSVAITGTGFRAGAAVTFGGTLAATATVNSATSVTAVTPRHAAGPVNIQVTNVDALNATALNGFTYMPPASRFYTLPPCRVFDTRNASGPDAATPALTGAGSRLFNPVGRCGVPASAAALSVNVTSTQASGDGYFALFPGDSAPTGTTTVSFRAGRTRANNQILTLGLDGTFIVLNGTNITSHFILDVNGFFGP